ncbi:MAG: STAS domain-containing protein [Acidimicrobiales bacterium]
MHPQVVELEIVEGRPSIRGECDLSNAAQVASWLRTFDGEPFELDLSGVTFLDSSALHVLLSERRRNPGMRIVAASTVVLRILDLTGTTEYLMAATGSHE